MRKFAWIIISVAAFSVAPQTFAQSETTELSGKCAYPEKPKVVNGRTASEEEMLAGQKEMKEYLALGNEFLSCLDEELAALGDQASEELRAQVVKIHNAVVDDMNAVADLFNAAIRAYKGKNSGQ